MNETPQTSARHCDQINQNAHSGSWHLDLGSQLLTCSDEACRVLGLDVGAPIAFERFLQCIHPEDRPLFDRAWDAAMCGKSLDLRCRIVSGGQVRWIHLRATFKGDASGRPRAADGTVEDITDLKRVEQALNAMRRQREVGQPRSRYALPIPSSSGRQLALPLCQREDTGNIRGCTGGCCRRCHSCVRCAPS